MRSKEAETYLNRCYKGGRKIKEYNRDMADKAVEIAEEEMRDKAIFSFCQAKCGIPCWIGKPQNNCDEFTDFMKELDN